MVRWDHKSNGQHIDDIANPLDLAREQVKDLHLSSYQPVWTISLIVVVDRWESSENSLHDVESNDQNARKIADFLFWPRRFPIDINDQNAQFQTISTDGNEAWNIHECLNADRTSRNDGQWCLWMPRKESLFLSAIDLRNHRSDSSWSNSQSVHRELRTNLLDETFWWSCHHSAIHSSHSILTRYDSSFFFRLFQGIRLCSSRQGLSWSNETRVMINNSETTSYQLNEIFSPCTISLRIQAVNALGASLPSDAIQFETSLKSEFVSGFLRLLDFPFRTSHRAVRSQCAQHHIEQCELHLAGLEERAMLERISTFLDCSFSIHRFHRVSMHRLNFSLKSSTRIIEPAREFIETPRRYSRWIIWTVSRPIQWLCTPRINSDSVRNLYRCPFRLWKVVMIFDGWVMKGFSLRLSSVPLAVVGDLTATLLNTSSVHVGWTIDRHQLQPLNGRFRNFALTFYQNYSKRCTQSALVLECADPLIQICQQWSPSKRIIRIWSCIIFVQPPDISWPLPFVIILIVDPHRPRSSLKPCLRVCSSLCDNCY